MYSCRVAVTGGHIIIALSRSCCTGLWIVVFCQKPVREAFWGSKSNFLALLFSTLFWTPLFETLFELWTDLGMILEVFWHRFEGPFLKRLIFKKAYKNQWFFDGFPCQSDPIFINFSTNFLVPPPGHLKINFFTFLHFFDLLLGPQNRTSV